MPNFLLFFLFFLLGSCVGEKASLASTSLREFAMSSAINDFALKLHPEIQKEASHQNIIWSPASLYQVLAMVGIGSNGETYAEMKGLLGDIKGAKLSALQNDEALSAFNRLYLQNNYEASAQYLHDLKQLFSLDVSYADFMTNPAQERENINNWVEEKTDRRISNLLPQGVITELTRLVLVNTILFKGTWAKEFEKRATHDSVFTNSKGETEKIKMMFQKAKFFYGENESFQWIELPYQGERFVLQIILPRKSTELTSLMRGDLAEQMKKIILDEKEVELFMPRLKASLSLNPQNALESLGMRAVFSPTRADLTGISTKDDLFVSAIVHKGDIEIDEKGTVAAAASAAVISRKSIMMPQEQTIMRLDRPFGFFLMDKKEHAIVFMGEIKSLR